MKFVSVKDCNYKKDSGFTVKDPEVVGFKDDRRFVTQVDFNDGFSYRTFLTDRKGYGLLPMYSISIGNETTERIIREAKIAHNRKIEVWRQSNTKTDLTLPIFVEEYEKLYDTAVKLAKIYISDKSRPLFLSTDYYTSFITYVMSYLVYFHLLYKNIRNKVYVIAVIEEMTTYIERKTREHLESCYKKMTKTPDERKAIIKERIQMLINQRELILYDEDDIISEYARRAITGKYLGRRGLNSDIYSAELENYLLCCNESYQTYCLE